MEGSGSGVRGFVDGCGVGGGESDGSVHESGAVGVVEPYGSVDAIVGVEVAKSVSKSPVDANGAVGVEESEGSVNESGAVGVAESEGSVNESGAVGVADSEGSVNEKVAMGVAESEGPVDGSGAGTAEAEKTQTAAARAYIARTMVEFDERGSFCWSRCCCSVEFSVFEMDGGANEKWFSKATFIHNAIGAITRV